MNTQAIAQHLNILESAIQEIQEWANVLWVKFIGGCRFVSKKVVKKMESKIPESVKKAIEFAERVKADPTRFVMAKKKLESLIKDGEQGLKNPMLKSNIELYRAGIDACKEYLANN